MENPFRNYEPWRLIVLAEMIDILSCLNDFENVDAAIDRLYSTARLLREATAVPVVQLEAFEYDE